MSQSSNTILLSWHPNADLGRFEGELLSQGDFHRYFSRIGAVNEVQLDSERSRARVTFADRNDAECVLSLSKIEIRGRRIFARPLDHRETSLMNGYKPEMKITSVPKIADNCNLVIKNLCPFVTEEELRSLFIKFGPIQSMLLKNQCGSQASFNKNYSNMAFVAFYDAATAKEALEEMNGRWVGQRNLMLTIAKPRPVYNQ